MNDQKKSPKTEEASVSVALFDYIEMFVFAVVTVILVLTFACRICVVSGPSMNKTLLDGERLLVSDFFYTPEQGDIIVFHQTNEVYDQFNEPIVKRVIATGGQFVKIDYVEGKVYVSDDDTFEESEALNESAYAYFEGYGETWKEAAYSTDPEIHEIHEGYLFVMGDNRNHSADSRKAFQNSVGLVDERRVLGKVLCRLTPFSKFGSVS